jgi:integrase
MASIEQLLRANRLPRKQKGQRIETRTAFFLRYYVSTTDENGASVRKQECVKLADKSDLYRSWADVEPLIGRELEGINKEADLPSGQTSIADFIEKDYLPWCEANKSAPTANGYTRVWENYWKPHIGAVALTALQTAQVTAVLTKHAKAGKGSRTLSHIKWFLSGVYVYAISSGVVPKNPVPDAKWLLKVARPEKQAEYSLETILAMLRILEPLDLRAAVAVALAYFAALRPSEIRGLRWEDYDGAELKIKRGVWRDKIGETKNEGSAASVPVIEPLKSFLEKLRAESADGFMLQNGAGNPLSPDSLNMRVITPAMEKAGIDWRGYYPGRRGISSRVTDTSKNALNSTGLLRHSTPITALKHYTRAQKDSIAAAMKTIEQQALELMDGEGSVQYDNGPAACCTVAEPYPEWKV